MWNDVAATPAQKSALLWDIRRLQSPGLQRMMDALRTPMGRPVGICLGHG